MKNIIKSLFAPVLVLALSPLFTACDSDIDSNPTLQEPTSFVLNTPANAENNTYDLANADYVNLTCSQPDYGGFPLSTTYNVQVSIDNKFANPDTAVSNTAAYKELATTYTTAKLPVDASEINDAVVTLYQEANNGAEYPSTEKRSVYMRLRANITGTQRGNCLSNTISLPNVLATYKAPAITLPTQLFVVGSSIGEPWSTWKALAPVYGMDGEFYTMIYCPANASFKWGTYKNDWRGYSAIKTVKDDASAGLSTNGDGNVVVSKAGWYVVYFVSKIIGKEIQYTLNFEPGAAYIIGNATGSWTDADPAWAMTAPADASSQWVSPAFSSAEEMRAYIKVPGRDWWRTEFTLYKGGLYFRTVNIPSNWATDVGSDYSVSVTAGQKLYVDFDKNTGEVK